MAIVGDKLFQEIKDIFELPDEVCCFELRIAVGEVVTVKTEYFPNTNGEDLLKLLKKYTLCKLGKI